MSNKLLYIPYKRGIYMQQIVGVFDDLTAAKVASIHALEEENDDYHVVFIAKMKLNKSYAETINHSVGGYEKSDNIVAEIYRENKEVRIRM